MGQAMILANCKLRSRANQIWDSSGIDSYEFCLDRTRFQNFPFSVEYRYNSRGFRDEEWPGEEKLQDAIWCVGDSFTVGIGSPFDHIWPRVLQSATGIRTINVSMDGASNDWISRMAKQICQEVKPKYLVVMWSYLERREFSPVETANQLWQESYDNCRSENWPDCPPMERFSSLPISIRVELKELHKFPVSDDYLSVDFVSSLDDDNLRIYSLNTTDQEDLKNWQECILALEECKELTRVIHSVVPDFCKSRLITQCQQIFDQVHLNVPFVTLKDLARDGHHFGLLTSQWVVDKIKDHLVCHH